MPARAISISRSFSSRDQEAMRFSESGAIMISSTVCQRVLASSYCVATTTPSPVPGGTSRNRTCRRLPKFARQLSGARHFNVSLSTKEGHLASASPCANGRAEHAWGTTGYFRVRRYRARRAADRHVDCLAGRHHQPDGLAGDADVGSQVRLRTKDKDRERAKRHFWRE